MEFLQVAASHFRDGLLETLEGTKIARRPQQSANQQVCIGNKMAALFLPLLLLPAFIIPLSILFWFLRARD